MSVEVRIPAKAADQPAWIGVVGVAAACLVAGVLIASLGVTPARTEDEREGPGHAAPSVDGETESPTTEDDEPSAEPGEAQPADPDLAAGPLGDTEPPSASTPASTPSASTPSTPSAATPSAATPSAEPAPAPSVGALGPLPTLSEPPARMERGRVAYLRCSGVERRGGPFPCPRDEALEIRAWNALDAIARCPALADATGEGDVVLDFREAAAPEVRSRDTFAREVRRLDAEATLACVAPALAAIRHQTGAQRLVVSLRFALR